MLKAFDAKENEMLQIPIHEAIKLPNLSKTHGELDTRTVTMVKIIKQGHVYHQNDKWS